MRGFLLANPVCTGEVGALLGGWSSWGSGWSGSWGSGCIGSRSSGWCSSRSGISGGWCRSSNRCWSSRSSGFFFFAASGQSSSGDDGGQNEGLVHFDFPNVRMRKQFPEIAQMAGMPSKPSQKYSSSFDPASDYIVFPNLCRPVLDNPKRGKVQPQRPMVSVLATTPPKPNPAEPHGRPHSIFGLEHPKCCDRRPKVASHQHLSL
jgi:hypothetical protein